ncbi:MAG: type VI secretion system tube protein Hcp [Psychromonas sp.]|nr:type VI secretion system tube protein Hcp [Psychromonas sp.]
MATVKMFMLYETIQGGIGVDDYKENMALLSCDFGVWRGFENAIAGTTQLGELNFTKPMCVGSTELLKEFYEGTGKKVVISMCRADGKNFVKTMGVEMENVFLTTYHLSIQGESPVETGVLHFTSLGVEISVYEDGKPVSVQVYHYDPSVVGNKGKQ